ncbi:Ubiquinone/menaquinone biosynthesis C-methylase UbiE [Nakamurella panacisegetis]|uniref:Ubiquinone/menaquinone biosynthesis C-methylase UbiE n=1 Tax=Nakamurella panacisegetis TaxID=1090615 RepID=A0A1H0QM65_9ACTN|nr:class I SAM-dependent methyltransferase [Nakamurella panacisegetis]SDP18414.1 Ubiquinone/menaquinone biosynthesis C-methylase UbiE [Nakamurella panacisegetis]
MTESSITLDPIKSKHRAIWALGDYDRVSVEVVGGLGPALVEAADIRPGDRVLDVAAGSGNASLPAAARGACVVATDLTPELIETGRQRSATRGLAVDWKEADAQYLPFGDDEFDVTLSCVGVMFAPFHQPVADELLRVTRSGGRIAMINWTPEGFIGQMFAAMKPFVPAPPPGSTPGPRWGAVDHVRELFGDRIAGLRAERRLLPVDRFTSGADFRDYFATHYGPTLAAYRNVADDPDLTAALDGTLIELANDHGAVDGHMDWEYLLVVAEVA